MTMLAPGIRYVEVEAAKASEDALRPDVAGFAGIFERGPILVPRRIEDWGEHRSDFGGFVPISEGRQALTPLALHGFFRNGGGTAILFRFGARGMRAATAALIDPATGARIGLAASSPGRWGSAVELRVPLAVMVSRVLPGGFPSNPGGLRGGDIVRVFDKADSVVFGTLTASGAGVDLPAAAGMTPPLLVEVIGPDVDITIEGPDRRERLRGLSLRPGAPNNVWRALARGRRGPEWEPEIPPSWLPLADQDHLALALEQQGPGASLYLRATTPAGWPDGPPAPLPPPWAPPSIATLQSARTGLLQVSLENGSDDLQGIDASVVQSAIAALARHPLPSLVAIPDLMLPFVHPDAGCPRIPEFDARRPFLEAAPPPRAEPEIWPSEPAPEEALPSYGPSVELLQDELIQAIWTTREHMAEKIVLLDPPPGADPGEILRRAGQLRDRFDADDAGFRPASTGAMFYPWIRVLDPAAGRQGTALVPPSGYVAGIMARASREGGAGARFANEPIVGAVACERALSEDERGELNAARVSALHAVAGRGPGVFGARTLSAQRRPDVFIPAARVLAFVRRALRILGETLVFEPNDALLTQRIRVGADRVLRELFRSGAFVGRSPREAYAVRCDASTTPPEEIARGRVIAEVDVALAVPLEFITLRVAFARDGSNVLDGVPRERG